VSTVPFSHATPAAHVRHNVSRNNYTAIAEEIIWANHANDYKRMIGTRWDLEECVRSVIDFVDQPGDGITWKNTLVIVTADHGNSYMRLNDDKKLGAGDLPEQNGTNYPGGEVTYASTEHTNELVTLYAMGNGSFRRIFHEFEGSWYPRTRIIDNTQLFHIMMQAAGCPMDPQLSVIEGMGAPLELSAEERN
jgi:alkaline phosphatase